MNLLQERHGNGVGGRLCFVLKRLFQSLVGDEVYGLYLAVGIFQDESQRVLPEQAAEPAGLTLGVFAIVFLRAVGAQVMSIPSSLPSA